jgi:hypothetical protein
MPIFRKTSDRLVFDHFKNGHPDVIKTQMKYQFVYMNAENLLKKD